MGALNVKNTIVERLLQIIAPHPCLSCGILGFILCDNCKYDITCEPFVGCFLCGRPKNTGVCKHHGSPISRSYIATSYESIVKELVEALKFQRLRQASREAAALIHARLPELPEGAVFVPVPTVRAHIRERGYDQAALIAAHLGDMRSTPVVSMARRVNKATQHTSSKAERSKQALGAFELKAGVKAPAGPIIIVDDVVTTGSTAEALALALAPLGVPIWLAAVSYKPLD